AVLNGKIDLVQAEAVGDLIDATAPSQARAALAQLEGGLSRRLDALRESLVELQAVLGYEIDFPEEDDGPVPRERIAQFLDDVHDRIDRLIATAPAGERLREGALVVLAGQPNAGKSSLFNALLGETRALVTDIPGTTRDAIEVLTDVAGWPVRMVDTAGLWESDHAIDQMGIAVSHRYFAAADLVLLCVDGDRALDATEQDVITRHSTIVVRTKCDLHPGDVSAHTGAGLAELRENVAARLFTNQGTFADLTPMLTRERHRTALIAARGALAEARPHVVGGDVVLAAHHIRQATGALEELLGVVDVEEVLGRVFAAFCVGK
ncbi:MAG: 50S ribosome-binding GTPase, partial [Gemmatimonadales bacterium]|nr:50S ribosome-binding GTPase [Gemmatimonadales bacterium]